MDRGGSRWISAEAKDLEFSPLLYDEIGQRDIGRSANRVNSVDCERTRENAAWNKIMDRQAQTERHK